MQIIVYFNRCISSHGNNMVFNHVLACFKYQIMEEISSCKVNDGIIT